MGDGNGKPVQYSCLGNPMNSMKRQTYMTLKDELPRFTSTTHSVVDVTGGGSEVQCCEEQYCKGTWNIRFMNQGKLEVVKQDMAGVNIDILGISELKWTGMGEFNPDDHYLYYCGQESLRINGVAIIVNKKSQKFSTWMQSQK